MALPFKLICGHFLNLSFELLEFIGLYLKEFHLNKCLFHYAFL